MRLELRASAPTLGLFLYYKASEAGCQVGIPKLSLMLHLSEHDLCLTVPSLPTARDNSSSVPLEKPRKFPSIGAVF